jgi:hypothetical protein
MPRSRGLRQRRSEAEWKEILRRFAASSVSARDFCRREGLALSSLQRWRARLGDSSARGEFVELRAAPARAVPAAEWTVELTLPGGVSLRLRS